MTRILGISAFYHDSAAALVIDGKIAAAVQEERFTRIKHTADFPIQAIKYCLDHSGLDLDELDAVIFYDNTKRLMSGVSIINNTPFYLFRFFCITIKSPYGWWSAVSFHGNQIGVVRNVLCKASDFKS